MINIDCRVGLINAGLGLPPALFDANAQTLIGNVFQQASRNDFQLSMEPPQLLPNAVAANMAVTALDLHVRLAYLVGAPTQGPVSRIGLLLAHMYQGFEGALGVMFDRGMPTPDDPNASKTYTSVPRQGCAVFLGAIEQFRSTAADRIAEARFTTLHELGHVFNLPHTAHRTLMSISPWGAPLTYPNTRFDQHQCEWLSMCSNSLTVVPGGYPFGTGPFDPYGHFDSGGVMRSGKRARDLRLSIDMAPPEMLPGAPAELELSLSVKRSARGRYIVPEMLDPAYGCFSIFIEDPRGERHIYRPSLRQCPHGQRVVVTAGKPYRRDINITRQQGRSTFRYPGIYRIHVEFRVAKDTCLKSNMLEVLVRKPRADDQAQELFRDRRVSSVLMHKQDLADGLGIERLTNYCAEKLPRSWSNAYAHFALGSALLQNPAGQYTRRTDEELQSGIVYIERALEGGRLTDIKEQSAQRKLDAVR